MRNCPHCHSDAGQEPDEFGLWCIECGKDVNMTEPNKLLRILGIVMVCGFFAGLFVTGVVLDGWVETIKIATGALGIAAFITIASLLINQPWLDKEDK